MNIKLLSLLNGMTWLQVTVLINIDKYLAISFLYPSQSLSLRKDTLWAFDIRTLRWSSHNKSFILRLILYFKRQICAWIKAFLMSMWLTYFQSNSHLLRMWSVIIFLILPESTLILDLWGCFALRLQFLKPSQLPFEKFVKHFLLASTLAQVLRIDDW